MDAGRINGDVYDDIYDVVNDYKRRRQLGNQKPPPHTPRNYSKVKVKNVTGGDLRRGEIVEFTDFLLTELEQDYLWFEGSTPDLTKCGWGITLKPIPSTEIDEVLCLGVCIAYVNILDETHQYAVRNASLVLQSAATGPVKILHKPTGGTPPEERECVVQLMDEDGDYVDVVQVYHSGSGNLEPVAANADNVHPGRVKRVISATMTTLVDCWILFVDQFDDLDGDVPALNLDYYGPARYSGTYTSGAVTLPLLVVRRGYEFEELIIHFELSATLPLRNGGAEQHALAKLLEWNGTAWVDSGTEIEVYDWFGTEGMWNGITGYRGWAKKRSATYTDTAPDPDVTRQAYEIIWMERIAQFIQFTSTEYMGASTGGRMATTVNFYDHQGKDPGATAIVRDPQGQFPDVHSGAKGTAEYDNRNGYYRVVSCQRVALFAGAILSSNQCGGALAITSFSVSASGDYVGTPPTAPTSAGNGQGHAGLSSDPVALRRTNNGMPQPTWEVIDMAKHVIEPITEIRLHTGGLLQYRTQTWYAERCTTDNNAWTTWHTATECP